jgi:hypothetical protein
LGCNFLLTITPMNPKPAKNDGFSKVHFDFDKLPFFEQSSLTTGLAGRRHWFD